jgi:uncharacterized membrane protein YeaQ/YmgE (transglycosylase-associated protein family)
MSVFAYIIVGLLVGLAARVALPTPRQIGFWSLLLLGMVGGLVGGLFSSMLLGNDEVYSRVHPVALAVSLLFAAAATVGVTLMSRRRISV